MSLGKIAQQLAENSFAVFPLVPSGKAPAVSGGFHSASLDPDKIKQWWDANPSANIGIACGEESHHLVVIDVDNKHGHDGSGAIHAWMKQHGVFPETLTVHTPNGGIHLYYRDMGAWNSPVGVLDGVDIRCNGSYVVGPGSVLPSGEYWIDPGKPQMPAMINESVKELLQLRGHASESERHEPSFIDTGEPVGEGGRNKFLSDKAGALVKKYPDWSEEQLQDEIRRINQERCIPPLDESELRKTVFRSLSKWKKKRDAGPPDADVVIREGDIASIMAEQQQRDNPDPADDELVMESLDEVEEKQVEWLIPNYIPAKQITLLVGTGGVGKTSVWCSIESSLSRGMSSFMEGSEHLNDTRRPVDVMFFSSEDTVSEVLKKRIRRCGGDMTRFRFVDLGDPRFPKIQFGSKLLDAMLDKYRPKLVVFDPLQSFIPGNIKMSDRNAMRQCMNNLVVYGAKYGVTSLVVMHTNKLQNAWGRARMADSADIWDIARSVLMVGEADREDHTAYISHEKCNYGTTGRTVIFKNNGGVPNFMSYSDKKDREFVHESVKIKNQTSASIEDCQDLILSEVNNSDEDHKVFINDLTKNLEDMGYSKYQIRTALTKIKQNGFVKIKKDGFQGRSFLTK